MFTKEEISQVTKPYFRLIQQNDDFLEIQSKNTRHCWIIRKSLTVNDSAPINIFHKHTLKISSYHKQCSSMTLDSAIKKIKEHDTYVIRFHK